MNEPAERPHFPATGVSHTPSGPMPTCQLHAKMIRTVSWFLGVDTNRTMLTEPAECANCINAWKAKQWACV